MRKDCVSRELTREIVVGAFMVMILLGLGYFTIILSRESLFAKKVDMEIVFANVMGLRDTDPVVVRGMPVGKVQSLELADDGVHVVVTLDEPLTIWKDYRITVETTSMLGGRHMVIDTGSPLSGKRLKTDRLRGIPPHDIIADAAELVNSLKKGIIEDGMIENLRVASAELREVAERIGSGKGTLGRLMSDDETMYDDIAGAVASLRTISGRLESGKGTLGKLMSEDDALYEDLKSSAASVRKITGNLAEGKGTIGRLMDEDDQLYRDLEDMVQELRATIDDFRETSPVTTFTSIFFGAF